MSISYSVVAVIKANDEHIAKCNAYWACEKAGIDIPEELEEYFNWKSPDIKGAEIDLEPIESGDRNYHIYDIDLKTLPENTRYIRFKVG